MRWISLTAVGAMVVLALSVTTALAGDAGKAKRDLFFAKDQAESERWDDFGESMKKAQADMEGLTDAEKAPLLESIKEIKAIVTKSIQEEVTKRLDKAATADDPAFAKLDIDRAVKRLSSDEVAYADPAALEKLRMRLKGLNGGSAPATPTPTTPTPSPTTPKPAGPMSDELYAANRHVRTAHSMFDQNDYDLSASQIRDAYSYLAKVPQADAAPLLADLVQLSKLVDEALRKKDLKERHDDADRWAHLYVGDAVGSIQDGIICEPAKIDKAEERLGEIDTQTYLSPDEIKAYQDQIAALRVKLKAHNKAVALERCVGPLKELEDKLSADPFKGLDNFQSYSVFNKLKSLSLNARGWFRGMDQNDPDIKAILDRVAAADAKAESFAGQWAVEKVQTQFVQTWKFDSKDIEGWQSETLSPDSASTLRVEGLGKTIRAVGTASSWLNNRETTDTLKNYKDNAVISATAAEARKTLEDASAKLNDAFNGLLTEVEHRPMPKKEAERDRMAALAQDASKWFANTKYQESNFTRAKALDTKWKADVAAAEKEMEETLKKLSAQADAAWPMIELASGAERGFDPAQLESWKGKTIIIKGYYNRSGWDFDGQYDYAIRLNKVPVAGTYDPKVAAAFGEGSHHTKFGINDHIGWDVIAVVQDMGIIKKCVTTEWRDAKTHEVIMKTESYVPEPCVMIKIIGLHAGPVAVGPK